MIVIPVFYFVYPEIFQNTFFNFSYENTFQLLLILPKAASAVIKEFPKVSNVYTNVFLNPLENLARNL
jgi:hypothetical protein